MNKTGFSIRVAALVLIAALTVFGGCIEHDENEWIIDKEPTCTEKGLRHRQISGRGEESVTEDIPALGHDWGEPSYSFQIFALGRVCEAVRTCRRNAEHKETAVAAVTKEITKKPSCTEKGETTYKAVFSEDWAASYTETVADIPATGHTESDWIVDKEPSCEEQGKRHKICTVCGETVATETVPAKGHAESGWIVDKEPSCEEQGKRHKICVICGETLVTETVSAKGHIESGWIIDKEPSCEEQGKRHKVCVVCGETVAEEIIPASGHDWGEPVYSFSDDGKSCTVTRTCKRDPGHKETATAAITKEITKNPSCDENGETTYTAVFSVNWAESRKKTLPDIAATGHDWGEPVYSFAEDGSRCTAERTCKNDASHKQTVKASITSEITKKPTCTEKGETTYKAVFAEDWAAEQRKTVQDLPPSGHTESDWIVDSEPSCESAGKRHKICAVCGETLAEEIVPALGHDWGPTVYIFEADGSSCTAERKCMRDETHMETETVHTTQTVAEPATCDKMGKHRYTAEFKSDWAQTVTKDIIDIPALGCD